MSENNGTKVLIELHDGKSVTGTIRAEHSEQIQIMNPGGGKKPEIRVVAPMISLYRGFADIVGIDADDIKSIQHAN